MAGATKKLQKGNHEHSRISQARLRKHHGTTIDTRRHASGRDDLNRSPKRSTDRSLQKETLQAAGCAAISLKSHPLYLPPVKRDEEEKKNGKGHHSRKEKKRSPSQRHQYLPSALFLVELRCGDDGTGPGAPPGGGEDTKTRQWHRGRKLKKNKKNRKTTDIGARCKEPPHSSI